MLRFQMYKVSGGLVYFGNSMLFHSLHCGIIKFLTIGKLFMNNSENFMDEFGVPIVGKYIDCDWYAVFDVEDILYNVGLVNYKNNNEGIYKVICPYAVFGEKLDKRTPRKLNYILNSSM